MRTLKTLKRSQIGLQNNKNITLKTKTKFHWTTCMKLTDTILSPPSIIQPILEMHRQVDQVWSSISHIISHRIARRDFKVLRRLVKSLLRYQAKAALLFCQPVRAFQVFLNWNLNSQREITLIKIKTPNQYPWTIKANHSSNSPNNKIIREWIPKTQVLWELACKEVLIPCLMLLCNSRLR